MLTFLLELLLNDHADPLEKIVAVSGILGSTDFLPFAFALGIAEEIAVELGGPLFFHEAVDLLFLGGDKAFEQGRWAFSRLTS